MPFKPETYPYSSSLKKYIDDKRLPDEFFTEPDYVFQTAASTQEFDEIVDELSANAKEVVIRAVDERFMAIARLSGIVVVPNFGVVDWASIKEPTLEEAALSFRGINAVGFYYPNAEKAAAILSWRGVPHTVHESGDGHVIDATYDFSGYGFKISTSRLEESELAA